MKVLVRDHLKCSQFRNFVIAGVVSIRFIRSFDRILASVRKTWELTSHEGTQAVKTRSITNKC